MAELSVYFGRKIGGVGTSPLPGVTAVAAPQTPPPSWPANRKLFSVGGRTVGLLHIEPHDGPVFHGVGALVGLDRPVGLLRDQVGSHDIAVDRDNLHRVAGRGVEKPASKLDRPPAPVSSPPSAQACS